MSYQGKFTKKARAGKKAKSGKKNVVLIVLIVILSLVVALLIGGVVYYNHFLNQIDRFDEEQETLSSEELENLISTMPGADLGTAPIDTVPETLDVMSDEEETIGGDIINILLIGQDTRQEGKRGLSDSMILVSVNTETKKLVMTSFMRDLYVEIPSEKGGYYKYRINTAYPVGGMELLDETLEHNFGVEIDNNIEVDFSGFQTVVDAMGGVDIELTKAEANYMNHDSGQRWDLTEGMAHLDGEQALCYSRIRKIDDDFVRTSRQRTVLNKLFEKVKTMSLTEILALAEEVIPLITTDMTNAEITEYIMKLVPLLPELEVESLRIPLDGQYSGHNIGTKENPGYVFSCNLTTTRAKLRETIGVESAKATEPAE